MENETIQYLQQSFLKLLKINDKIVGASSHKSDMTTFCEISSQNNLGIFLRVTSDQLWFFYLVY